jgi:hypothetical protein
MDENDTMMSGVWSQMISRHRTIGIVPGLFIFPARFGKLPHSPPQFLCDLLSQSRHWHSLLIKARK